MIIYRADVEIYRKENGCFLTNDDFRCILSKTLDGALHDAVEFVQNRLAELYLPEDEYDTFDSWMATEPVSGDIWICEVNLEADGCGSERVYNLAGRLVSEC